MDINKAIHFILRKGNSIEKARLNTILFENPASKEAIQELATFQKKDGGFSYWVKDVSNICDTIYILFWFDDLKIYRGSITEPACRFLLDRQQSDGGWDEVKAVSSFNPPEWMIPGRIETRVWLSAYCAHALISFGYAEAEGTYCPTDFLLAHSDENGQLTGYLRATWIALPMLAFFPGINSKSFQKALNVLENNFSSNWEGAYLAWLLRCLHDAGLPTSNSLVNRCFIELKKKQRKDGSWEPERGEGEEHAINATLSALRALKEYRYI